MGITHATAATGTDSGDGKISKNAWNEAHVVSGLGLAFIGCRVKKVATIQGTGANFAIAFDAEDFDTDTFHDNSTNNTRITIPAGLGGKYLVGYEFATPSGVSNDASLSAWILKGGTTQFAISGGDSGTYIGKGTTNSTILDLAAGDYLELRYLADNAAGWMINPVFWAYKLDSGKVGQGIGASVVKSALQTLTTAVEAAVQWDGTDLFDTDGFHDPSSNNTRLTIPAGLGGKYLVTTSVDFAAHATGKRWIHFRKNGSTDLGNYSSQLDLSANNTYLTASAVFDLAAGDYVEIMAYQTSGGNLDIEAGSAWAQIMRLDSGSGERPTLIHTHSVTTEHTGTNCSGAWTDLSDNTTFTKSRASSMLRVSGRFAGQVRETSAGDDLVAARAVIDSGGTPQYLMLASGVWGAVQASNYVMLQGGTTHHLVDLAAGSHTVKIQAITGGTGDIYLRPSGGTPYEYGVVEIVEE